MFDNLNPFTMLLIAVAVVIVFFILRELSLWFYRINEIINNQKTTNSLLRIFINLQATGDINGSGNILVRNNETKEYVLMEKDEWIKLLKESPEQSTFTRV